MADRHKSNNYSSLSVLHWYPVVLAELALKSRKEIADYIQAGKEDRARIRVSQAMIVVLELTLTCSI